MSKRAQHGLGQRTLVPWPLIAAVVDEEGRRFQHAAVLCASNIISDPRYGDLPCCSIFCIARRQFEVRCDPLEVSVTERRPLFHEGVMDAPELAGRFRSVFRKFCRSLGLVAPGNRSMPEHVPHPVPESVAQIRNDFMHGMTVTACIAAVLNQGDWSVGVAQDMIASIVDHAIQFHRSCMNHRFIGPLLRTSLWRPQARRRYRFSRAKSFIPPLRWSMVLPCQWTQQYARASGTARIG